MEAIKFALEYNELLRKEYSSFLQNSSLHSNKKINMKKMFDFSKKGG